MGKFALLIGVSKYGTGLDPLPGTLKDVEAMHRVLQHPDMGGFAENDIQVLKNPSKLEMEEAIEKLFSRRKKDDLLLLFFSGHGIDESFKLYLTNSETRNDEQGNIIIARTTPASWIHERMENSRSQQQVIILDCCYSGAFAKGMVAKGSGNLTVDIKAQLGGEGRAVLTSSAGEQRSFGSEGEEMSVYTRYIVEGIETGAADTDNDGMISVDELHEFAKKKVQEAAPAMKPEIYAVKEGFKILLAKAPIGDPKLEYRKEVEKWVEDGQIIVVGRRILNLRQRELGLSDHEATFIENVVLLPYRKYQQNLKEYEESLTEAIKHEGNFGQKTQEALKRLQQLLHLRDEDVTSIEQKLLNKAENCHQSTITQSNIADNSNNQHKFIDNTEINSIEIQLAEQKTFPETGIFERFTESANNVITIAKEEAKSLGHNFVGSEQILLGLIKESSGIAANILKSQGIKYEDAHIKVKEIIGLGSGTLTGNFPFTSRAKRIIDLSLETAREQEKKYVSTGHILLGILKEGGGIAQQVLERLGIDLQNLQNQTNRAIQLSVKSSNLNPEDDLSSEKGIDYTRLRDLLTAGEWKEADKETYLVMIQAVGKKDGDWFTQDELLNFPCTDLRTIDRLWVKYSHAKFGFSVQKEIYLSVGGKADGKYYDETWKKYCNQLQWRVKGSWMSYSEITFDTFAPKGHLPILSTSATFWGLGAGKCFSSLVYRLVNCNI